MGVKKERIDKLLVDRGIAETRARAQALILAGLVIVGESRVDKPGVCVNVESPIRLKGEDLPYVSRGGLKLEAALDHWTIKVQGLDVLDVGASTGGFTDCLLQRGAQRVVALDVGYGQLHPQLRNDPRVIVRERVNARYLTRDEVSFDVHLIVIDVSFISLKQVLPAALKFLQPEGKLIALVKPQFEAGKGEVGKGGVVRDNHKRVEIIQSLVSFVSELMEVVGWIDSPVVGPAGNREALVYARGKGNT